MSSSPPSQGHSRSARPFALGGMPGNPSLMVEEMELQTTDAEDGPVRRHGLAVHLVRRNLDLRTVVGDGIRDGVRVRRRAGDPQGEVRRWVSAVYHPSEERVVNRSPPCRLVDVICVVRIGMGPEQRGLRPPDHCVHCLLGRQAAAPEHPKNSVAVGIRSLEAVTERALASTSGRRIAYWKKTGWKVIEPPRIFAILHGCVGPIVEREQALAQPCRKHVFASSCRRPQTAKRAERRRLRSATSLCHAATMSYAYRRGRRLSTHGFLREISQRHADDISRVSTHDAGAKLPIKLPISATKSGGVDATRCARCCS